MSRTDDEMLSCIHSRGPTGKTISVGCFRTEQISCALHGTCVLKTCPQSRGLISCRTCMDFAPAGGPKAESFLAQLSEETRKDYILEPEVDLNILEDLVENDRPDISGSDPEQS